MAGKTRGQAIFCSGDARRTAACVSIPGILPGSSDSVSLANVVGGVLRKWRRYSLEPQTWPGKRETRRRFAPEMPAAPPRVPPPGILSMAAIPHRRQTLSIGRFSSGDGILLNRNMAGKTRDQATFCAGDARRTAARVSIAEWPHWAGKHWRRRFALALAVFCMPRSVPRRCPRHGGRRAAL